MFTQVKPINSAIDSSTEKTETFERSSFSSKWKEFASNTTLHGLRYVVQNGISIARRVIWLIFLCAVASAYSYFSSKSLEKFMSRPIKTDISQETPSGGLQFPAVTICNLNMFMKTKIDTTEYDENFEKLGLNVSGCRETRSVRKNLTCGQALLCAYQGLSYADVDNCNTTTQENIRKVLYRTSERVDVFNREQFMAKYGHDMEGMIFMHCAFPSSNMLCTANDFVPTVTNKGICYTFNSGSKSSIMKQTFGGPEQGLNIILNAQTYESTISTYSTGFQVIVHDQNTLISRDSGFRISPGTHTSVVVNLKKHIRLQAPFKTNCSSADQFPGLGNYTKDACLSQCYTNVTWDVCKCREAGYPVVKQMPVCSFQDDECVQKAKRIYANHLTKCPCNSACSELEYESRVSHSKFPDSSMVKIFQNAFKLDLTASYMQENLVFLQVGFQRLGYEKREEIPAYGFESLFGEVGGSMGLFLGCSLLTICEFIDFLWEVVTSKINKRSTNVSTQPNYSSY